MQLEIHAHRFGETDEERKKKINDGGVFLPITNEQELTIVVKDGICYITIDGRQQQMPIMFGKYEYSALVLTYEDEVHPDDVLETAMRELDIPES